MSSLRTSPLALLALAAPLALAGCDQLTGLWSMVAGTPAVTAPTHGAIMGTVVDRNGQALAGALISNGAVTVESADDKASANPTVVGDDLYVPAKGATDSANVPHVLTLEKGSFILTGVASGTNYVWARFDGVQSTPLKVLVSGGTFDMSKTAESERHVSNVGALKILVDTPAAGSGVRLAGIYNPSTNSPLSLINAATVSVGASSTLRYNPGDSLSLWLQAPPGGDGRVVRSYRLTYFKSDADTSQDAAALPDVEVGKNKVLRTLSTSVTIPPGTKTDSGAYAPISIAVGNSAQVFADSLKQYGEIKARIELFGNSNTAQDPVQTPDGAAIVVVFPLRWGN